MAYTAEQKVTRAKVFMMSYPPTCWLAGVMMMGKTEVVDNIPTAATNGRDEFYGRKFTESLEDVEVRGVVLHENLHKGLRQIPIWQELAKIDKKLLNMAMDYVINLIIYDIDPQGRTIRLPKGGLLDEQYRNMNTGEVFRKLQEDKQNGKGNGSRSHGSQSGQGESGDGSFDEHDWEGAQALSDEEQQQLAEDIDEAVRQGKLLAGRLKGDVPRAIGEMLEPKVKWEDELAEFFTATTKGDDLTSYRKPNRRMMSSGSNFIFPAKISESIGRIVVAVDTSGSIWGTTLTTFLSEVYRLCELLQPEGIDLLYWDSGVAGHEKYDEGSYAGMLVSTKPVGGGGTTPQCVVDYMKDKQMRPQCVVMLTDGMVDGWGNGWEVPTLWAITDRRITAPIGRSVFVNVN